MQEPPAEHIFRGLISRGKEALQTPGETVVWCGCKQCVEDGRGASASDARHPIPRRRQCVLDVTVVRGEGFVAAFACEHDSDVLTRASRKIPRRKDRRIAERLIEMRDDRLEIPVEIELVQKL